MGILNDENSYIGEKMAHPCKVDYEAQIKREKEVKLRNLTFLEALYVFLMQEEYIGKTEFTIQELVGRLEISIRQSNRTIERLIALQEQE